MLNKKTPISEATELLAALKSHAFLSELSLALYCSQSKEVTADMDWRLCEIPTNEPIIGKTALFPIEEALQRSAAGNKPVVACSPLGLFCFAVPLPSSDSSLCSLIGHGMRAKTLNLWQLEIIAKTVNTDPILLLEKLEKLPITTEQDLTKVADKVHTLIPSLKAEYSSGMFMEATIERLNAIVGMSAEIDTAGTEELAISLLIDTISILFDIQRIAVLIREKDNGSFSITGHYGLPADMRNIPAENVLGAIPAVSNGRTFVLLEEINSLFPFVPADYATCVPFTAGGNTIGMVILFGVELQERDALFMELLAARTAAKIAQLGKSEVDREDISKAAKVLAIINELPFLEDNELLYDSILDMAANLVKAACGSLMLLDKKGETLRIQSAKGMNMRLAKSLSLKLGSGIAGRVAASGLPLLVNDIEQDTRIAGQNRSRFKTRSFVSIPLKFREQLLGVLNLSDKDNQGIFDGTDLEMLSTFGNHASAVIRRSSILERSEQLEHLSITDPLTELFNRRFLDIRMEEELNRSLRQRLQMTVMLIDLDNFKKFNDLYGHVAGDKALKRVARILEKAVRDMDVVTRYGGEEFCLVLPGTAKMESMFVAERIRRGIEKEAFLCERNLPVGRLTASIGIASYPEDGKNATHLINSADIALYQAKEQGRNRIIIFNGPTDYADSGFFLQATRRHA